MTKMLRVLVILLALTLLLLSPLSRITTHARQDSQSPLLQLLAVVPDTDLAREAELSYADFYAMFAARPGAGQPRSYQDWNKLKESEGSEGALANATLMGISSSSPELVQQFVTPEKMIASIGIDPFTVERAIFYGKPPITELLLQGTFDPPTITKILQTKGYAKKDPGIFELWCATDDCQGGEKTNLKELDRNNPFGGNLGRKQPIIVSPTIVLSSTSIELISKTFSIGDQQTSLADNPDYKAAAQAITENGTLLQAYFVPPMYIMGFSRANIGGKAAEIIEKMKENVTPLPAYSLIVFAHVVHEDKQLTRIGLVYDSADDANAAIELIQNNIKNYTSLAANLPLTKMLQDRDGTFEKPTVFTADGSAGKDGKSVLVLTFSGELEPQEPIEGGKFYRASGLLYHLFVTAVMRGDVAWLAAEP